MNRLIALLPLALALSCTSPTTEMDLRLATQTLAQDFGTAMGTLPSIPCSAQLNLCAQLPVSDPRLRVSCDMARMECVGSYSALVYYRLDLSKDIAFQSGIGQSTADSIRQITLSYGMTNMLTFDLPVTDIFVAPANVMSTTAAGVSSVGQIGPFPAGVDVPNDSLQLIIEEGTPAFDFLVDKIAHPEVPFQFLLPTTVQLRSGNPFPAGKMELRLTPILKLLKR